MTTPTRPPAATGTARSRETASPGLLLGVGAYVLWGLFPLYWPLLEPSGAVEILAHRTLWSLVVVAVLLTLQRRWSSVRALPRRAVGLLAAAAVVIAVNWGVYIYGVNHHHVVETSLGYFINPLVTVTLGVVVLQERLRPGQWVAVGVGALAVVVLAVAYGRLPWIALVLAFSFGTYGLLKNRANVEPVTSLAVETGVLAGPALAYLLVLSGTGGATFTDHGAGHASLLVLSGVVTTVPLLLFAGAAIRLPLSTIGLLQYLAPVLQFLLGVLVRHEPMPPSRLAGFALVWLALVLLTVDGLRHRAARLARAAAAQAL